MQTFFNKNGKDNWSKIIKKPALSYMKEHSDQLTTIGMALYFQQWMKKMPLVQ